MKALPVVAILLVAGCSAEEAPLITVSEARISVVSNNAAAYFTLVNSGGADRLVAVRADGVGPASLHETVMDGDVMRMQPIEGGVEIPADGSVRFSAMGRHVMIMAGKPVVTPTVRLTLTFERQGDVNVDAPVSGPAG